nr:hypothetical protein [Nocardia salmonicida]
MSNSAIRSTCWGLARSAHAAAFLTHPFMEKVLVDIEFAGDVADRPPGIDDSVRGFDPVLG